MTDTEKKLSNLKTRLEATISWPWSNIEIWVASATPLIKRAFPDFYDDFAKISAQPRWTALPRFSSGGDPWRGIPPSDNDRSASASEDASNQKKAEEVRNRLLAFIDGLLDLPQNLGGEVTTGPASIPTFAALGNINFGAVTTSNFTNSHIGAAATAAGAVASHNAQVLKEQITAAQQAVVDDQDRLDDIHELLSDGLSKILRSVRKIELEQPPSEIIAQLKSSVDDIWVAHQLKDVKVPAGMDVAKAILASPVLAAGLKAILGAG